MQSNITKHDKMLCCTIEFDVVDATNDAQHVVSLGLQSSSDEIISTSSQDYTMSCVPRRTSTTSNSIAKCFTYLVMLVHLLQMLHLKQIASKTGTCINVRTTQLRF